MAYDPHSTATFTGHRSYSNSAPVALHITIATLHARGIRTFLCGMAVGFDLAAAEAVIASRTSLEGVRLIAVIPFEGQQKQFSATERARFIAICDAADEVVCLSPTYFTGCYLRRNDYLVNHSSIVVAWYDGSAGGTRYTVRHAERLGRHIMHLHPQMAQQRRLF